MPQFIQYAEVLAGLGAKGPRVECRGERTREEVCVLRSPERQTDRSVCGVGRMRPHVANFPGAKFKGFRTLAEAEDSLGDLDWRFRSHTAR